MNPTDIGTNAQSLYMNVWFFFTVMTLLGGIAHIRITGRGTVPEGEYSIRFFMLTFGTIGMFGLPLTELLTMYITTPRGYAALYLGGLVIAGVYMLIGMKTLIPDEHTTHDTTSHAVTSD